MSYNSPWRRMRRRNNDNIVTFSLYALDPVVKAFNLFVLLTPGWMGTSMAEWARRIWFLYALLAALVYFLVIPVRAIARWSGEDVWDTKLEWMSDGLRGYTMWISMLSQVGVIVMLAQGNLAGAFLFDNLPSAYCKLDWCLWRRTLWLLPYALTDLLLVAALPLHSFPLGMAAIALGQLCYRLIKPNLREILSRKLSVAQYAQRIQATRDVHLMPGEEPPVWRQENIIRKLIEAGQWEEAQRWLDRLRENPALKPEEEKTLQAQLDYGQGRYEAVLDLAGFPKSALKPEGKSVLALAYAHLGRKEEALSLAETLAPLKKEQWKSIMGDVHAALGDHPAALGWYEQSGRFYKGIHGLATTLKALGEYKEASFFYLWALRIAPYIDSGSLRDLAECYRHAGKPDAAVEAEKLGEEARDKADAVPPPPDSIGRTDKK